MKAYAEDQAARFDRFLEEMDLKSVKWEKAVLHGEPHEEILGFVRKKGCDLIVMGSEGRTGLRRLIPGSAAENVLREVPCSMLTVKAREGGA